MENYVIDLWKIMLLIWGKIYYYISKNKMRNKKNRIKLIIL